MFDKMVISVHILEIVQKDPFLRLQEIFQSSLNFCL